MTRLNELDIIVRLVQTAKQMNHDNLRLNSTHNPENSHKNMMRFQMHFSLDENERKLVSYLSEKLVLRISETSAIEQP